MVDVCFILLPNKPLGDPLMYSNLGMLYLTAVLERAGYDVAIADLRDKEINVDFIPRVRIYGISFTTGESADAKRLARLLKERDADCVTIAGGPHPTILPGDCGSDFDYVVIGEGEVAIVDIVHGVLNSGGVKGRYQVMPRIMNLNALPFPARHFPRSFSTTLMPGERYGEAQKATTVIWSRGCPFSCGFCANYMRAPVVYRSPRDIRAELVELSDIYGCHAFRVEDDNFGLYRDWAMSVCNVISPLAMQWKCHMRASLLSDELAAAMVASGCIEVGFGLESADQRVLDAVNKQQTVEDHRRAITIAKKHNLMTKVYFILNLPSETNETIELNKRFMKTAKPDKWTVSRFCLYPGSAIAKDPEAFGVRILDKDFSHYWNFPDRISHELVDASREELNRRYREFYDWMISDVYR